MLDFVEGKVTIPYLFLYERVEDKTKLASLYKKELSSEESAWIKEQMKITKALEDSILQAKEIGNEAISAVIDEKDSQTLVMIMKAMIEREF
jgi:octaprenyl-diphosphate synthase